MQVGAGGLRASTPELQHLLAVLARALGLHPSSLAARVTPGSSLDAFPRLHGLPGALLRLVPSSSGRRSSAALQGALHRLAGSDSMQAELRRAALLSLDASGLVSASPGTLLVGGHVLSLWRPSFAVRVDGVMPAGLAGANRGPAAARLAAWAANVGGVPAAALDVLAATPKASPATHVLRLSFAVVGEAAHETLRSRLAVFFQDTPTEAVLGQIAEALAEGGGVRRRALAAPGTSTVVPSYTAGYVFSAAVAQDGSTVVVGTVDAGWGAGVYLGVAPFGAANFAKVRWVAGIEAIREPGRQGRRPPARPPPTNHYLLRLPSPQIYSYNYSGAVACANNCNTIIQASGGDPHSGALLLQKGAACWESPSAGRACATLRATCSCCFQRCCCPYQAGPPSPASILPPCSAGQTHMRCDRELAQPQNKSSSASTAVRLLLRHVLASCLCQGLTAMHALLLPLSPTSCSTDKGATFFNASQTGGVDQFYAVAATPTGDAMAVGGTNSLKVRCCQRVASQRVAVEGLCRGLGDAWGPRSGAH